MDYYVIEATNQFDLIKEVRFFLSIGWTLHGGIALTSNDAGRICLYAQALVKPESSPLNTSDQ
jgi:hypothetical protein